MEKKRKYTRKNLKLREDKPLTLEELIALIPKEDIALIRNGMIFLKFKPNYMMTKEELNYFRKGWINKYGRSDIRES